MDKIYIELRINRDDPDDLALEQLVNDLTDRRELSSAIRASLPLYTDLNAGRLDFLFYLFPHLRRAFVQDSVPDKTPYDGYFVETLVQVAMQVMLPPVIYRMYQEKE